MSAWLGKFKKSIVFLSIGLVFLLANRTADGAIPALGGGYWYRGNTHTHARWSDTYDTNDVPTIAGWYQSAGYDFLVLSEHNTLLAVKQTIYHDEASTATFLMIPGLELSNSRHTGAFGINQYIGNETSLQDAVIKTLVAGGVPILHHPQSPVVTASAFIATQGLNHFEVFNGLHKRLRRKFSGMPFCRLRMGVLSMPWPLMTTITANPAWQEGGLWSGLRH